MQNPTTDYGIIRKNDDTKNDGKTTTPLKPITSTLTELLSRYDHRTTRIFPKHQFRDQKWRTNRK
ncbi:hypothetical protein D3C87_1604230 [compost metagenome]